MLRIPVLVVLDTGIYDSVQIIIASSSLIVSFFLREVLFPIDYISPVPKIVLMVFYDLICRSHLPP